MKSLGKKSTFRPVEVRHRAMEFCGPARLGLAPRSPNGDCVTVEGGDGYVLIEACPQGRPPAQEFMADVI